MSFLNTSLPIIIGVMKSVEEAIPGQGKGEAKLAAVRGILETIDDGFKTLGPQVLSVIGYLVKLFNATGVFKKGA